MLIILLTRWNVVLRVTLLQCYIEKGNHVAGIRNLRRAARIPVLGTDVRHVLLSLQRHYDVIVMLDITISQ